MSEYVRRFQGNIAIEAENMASSVGPTRGSDRTAMERFGDSGMALLPWTRQILCVLWEQLRLLVQVIYYSFMTVFQMFRFEVHVRITDDTGQRVQHMSSTANSAAESFLFSSLFDGENSVMVGGSNPLSNGESFPGTSHHAGALLSTLRAEDGLMLGNHPSWTLGFPGDWNIFLTSSDSSGTDDTCFNSTEKVFESKHDGFGEEKDAEEFDSEDSKALWESLSRSSDPYNPFFFSACVSSPSDMGKAKKEERDFEGVSPGSKVTEDRGGLSFWACRSDSENSGSSWGSSDGSSCADLDREESERLWDLLSGAADPYNPLCFTACALTATPPPRRDKVVPTPPPPAPRSGADTEERESGAEEEEERLWRSLSQNDDPYHPLNFRACLQSSPTATVPQIIRPAIKPTLPDRHVKKHRHPDTVVVPWRRPESTAPAAGGDTEGKDNSPTQKKVRFSPNVQVHVMRTWPFARQACRKGPWEELARDRDRFRRRIQETEDAIGYCFSHSLREKIRACLDSTSTSSNTLN